MPRTSRHGIRAIRCLHLAAVLMTASTAAASGPRWVTGPPYFTVSSKPVVWYTNAPRYFTDPGDLSPSVNHAAADALVAAAAGVWNVPTSALTLAKGGELAEHVSGENTYFGQNGPVFPADVSSANYAAIQIPVIYDSDGSITDLLLGQGASDPENCPQTGVTESVDAITTQGDIQHALLILNGRCTGPLPEQQLQLQYQLIRAFGRVLGLAWSQLNDNVFTGSPAPTAQEIANWPIMHPVDIVCGAYTFQCLPDAFTLRIDDVASISQLYFIPKGTAPAGKVDTLSDASSLTGQIHFGDGMDTGTQGMQGMNLLVRRFNPFTGYLDPGPVISTVTGNLFRWNNGNPVTGPPAVTIAASMGTVNPPFEGTFEPGPIPLLPGISLQDVFLTSEPVNPLYTGQYGLGPYPQAPVTPSGPPFPWRDNGLFPYSSNYFVWSVPGSVAECSATDLGTAAAPLPFASSGWWSDVLCGYGVSAWQAVPVQANRSLTVEVTALDEQGQVTENKLQPLIGVWNQGDPPNALPTVAAAVSPFNSLAAGLTALNFDTPQAGALRLAITDERGDGRPDFAFRARVLYADSISPANVPAGGGLVLLTGMGFRPGNTVTVGGVTAPVLATTANTILAIAPPYAALPAGSAFIVDVGVLDPVTGGSTFLYAGLTYPASAQSLAPQVQVITPAFFIAAGEQVGLTPKVILSQGSAPAPGVTVTWSSPGGALAFASPGQSASASNGMASIAATAGPLAAAAQTAGLACAFSQVCGSFSVTGVDPSLWTLAAIAGQGQSIEAAGILQPIVFQVTDGAGDPVIGAPVAIDQVVAGWETCPIHSPCPVAPVYLRSQASAVSDANGLVIVAPLQLTGTPETTTIAAATGTAGFLSVSVQKHP